MRNILPFTACPATRAGGWILILTLPAWTGCGDAKLGRVSGVVTLDGQPLPRATVEFQPKDGSPSYGITDEQGRYQLRYRRNQPGAEVGPHVVRVTTYDWLTNPDGSRTEIPEQVPPAYNVHSTLSFEVKRGSQRIDLELRKIGN
jgi:hypothetical protein